MSTVSEEKINQIINKADIVEIISSYIKLSKKGRNYWAVCPFHEDSNPSMSISPDKKIYKCFSCGASGNIIKFIENFEKLDFLSTLKKLALITGIDLSELKNETKTSKYNEKEQKIFEINNVAMNFYQMVLNSKFGSDAKHYLENRNIKKEELIFWGIGFASKEVKLYEKLIEKGFNLKEIEEAGLISIKEEKIYDFFFDRIIFPIMNEDGKVIGFSARTVNDIKPKYINSRENLVFKKSDLAYNVQNIQQEVNFKKTIIVLEGFMDVISMYKAGIKNTIAIMGTSLSDYHIKLFKRFKAHIKLFLDGDNAGIEATIKASKKIIANNISLSIIDNQTNMDPDELISNNDLNSVLTMIEESVYPLHFIAKKTYQYVRNEDPYSLDEYLDRIFSILIFIKSDVEKSQTLQKISEITKIDILEIKKYFENYSNKSNGQNQVLSDKRFENIKKSKLSNKELEAYQRAEQRVFLSLLKSDNFIDQVEENIENFNSPKTKMLVKSIIEEYKKGTYQGSDFNLISHILENKGLKINDLIFNLTEDKFLNILEMSGTEMDDSLRKMKIYQLEKEKDIYFKKISDAKSYIEQKTYLELVDKYTRKINLLKNKN